MPGIYIDLFQDSCDVASSSRPSKIERHLERTAKTLETLTAATVSSAATPKTISTAVSNIANSLDQLSMVIATSKEPAAIQARHAQVSQCSEPSKLFNFLGLPAEIRRMVYDLLVVDRSHGCTWMKVSCKEQLPLLLCNLHLVCRTILREIQAVFQHLPKRSLQLEFIGQVPKNPFASKSVKDVLTYPKLGSIGVHTNFTEATSSRGIVESILMSMHQVMPYKEKLLHFSYYFWPDTPEALKTMLNNESDIDDNLFLGMDILFFAKGGGRQSGARICGPLAAFVRTDLELALKAYHDSHGIVKNE